MQSLGRPWRPEDDKPLHRDPVIQEIAAKVQRSPFQVILRYLNQKSIIAIPKSCNPKNIRSNIQVFDFEINETDMEAISALNKNWRAIDFEWDRGHKYFPLVENYKE